MGLRLKKVLSEYVKLCVYMCVCVFVLACMHVCLCVCVCMCVCVYVKLDSGSEQAQLVTLIRNEPRHEKTCLGFATR